MVSALGQSQYVDNVELKNMSLGTGAANINVAAQSGLFNRILGEYGRAGDRRRSYFIADRFAILAGPTGSGLRSKTQWKTPERTVTA